MDTVYVFLADGFEEIEALTPVDTLRRAGVPVVTVGVRGTMVMGGHGIAVQADMPGHGFTLPEQAGLVVLPGGGKGTENLRNSSLVRDVLLAAAGRGIGIAAICAAPTILHDYGLLDGKRATAFPDVQDKLARAKVTGSAVEKDGNIITARSAGVALEFSHCLIEYMKGDAMADLVIGSLYPEDKAAKGC